jgi:DoxX-like family
MENIHTKASTGLSVSLWVIQSLLCLLFAGTGLWKLVTPVPQLAAQFPWMGQVPVTFMRATGLIDLLGGIGVLLPAITRVKPRLTALAAFGCAVLQACAIVFHVARGEAANTPFSFLLLALSLFVFWGRHSKAPIAPRT